MATENNSGVYDKGIGSEQRSAVAATKLWAILFGIVLLIGIGLITTFFFSGMGEGEAGSGGGGSTSSSPGP